MDIDELLCDIMTVINTNWVKSMSLEDEDEETRSDLIAQRMERRMQMLEEKVKLQAQTNKVNRQNIELIMQHIPELNKLKLASIPPQDETILDGYGDEEDDVKDLK